MAQFLHIPVMAADSISFRCEAHRLESVIGDSGAPRRRREDAAPRCQPAGRVPRIPGQVEAARTSHRSRIDALKYRVYGILHKALGVTFVVLLSGIAAMALDIYIWPGQKRFGVPLIYAGLAMTAACWALFLCTCSQRSRDFLEAFLIPCSLGDEWQERGAARRAKPTTGDPAGKIV